MVSNGSANVIGLDKFCDLSKIKKNVDYAKLEEIEIISNVTDINFTTDDVMKEISSFFGSEIKGAVELTKVKSVNPKPADVNKMNGLVANYVDQVVRHKDSSNAKPMSNVDQMLSTAPAIPNLDTQKRKEEKMQTLESIQHLREELIKMDISVDDIPTVNSESTYEDVRGIYSILRYKKNLNLHYEIARDCVLFGVNQLSYVFDGSKTSWGTMPDLRGWDRTAKHKLKSLKVELSTVVADAFNHYNVGPIGQILLALVPSALIHMSLKHEQRSRGATVDADESLQNLYDLNAQKR